VAANRSAFAIEDAFPASPGHTLVIPHRVVGTWWEATRQERIDLMDLLEEVKERLDQERHPDGYNVGFNSGPAAGQTIEHLHLHVIPRYVGDVEDPTGGVRHAVLGRGNYLLPVEASPGPWVLVDNEARTVVDLLADSLQDRRFDRADLMVSFVMLSGVNLIRNDLQDALDRGLVARILTTDYLGTTEPDALAGLMDLADNDPGRLAIRVFVDSRTSFHPKAYLFSSSAAGVGRSLVGSSNLSRSGIELGVEWTLQIGPARSLLDAFDRRWNDPRNVDLTHEWLRAYRARRPVHTWNMPIYGAPEAVVEEEAEPVVPPQARPIQVRALEALDASRRATGLDWWSWRQGSARPGWPPST
jgi:diadenosine tetraphosphate (Ap4A) HIT family hydrolase/HKD family nuclease